mmetsp:Transcript_29729/g.59094  ORF Transcript_29729/g.59094 Transcript_29729/m.59094 type:complete len:525 (-) Transcript_29729:1021-2595(-)
MRQNILNNQIAATAELRNLVCGQHGAPLEQDRNDGRIDQQNRQGDQLDTDKGQEPLKDIRERDMRRGHRFKVESRRPKGRRQERHLHVHTEHHAKPDRHVTGVQLSEQANFVQGQFQHDGQEHRDDQQHDADPVHERAHEQKDQHHEQDHRHGGQFRSDDEVRHIVWPARDGVGPRKGRGPDGHPHDCAGGFQGPHQRIPNQFRRCLTAQHGDDKDRHGPHARRFGDACNAAIDRPHDDADHHNGRHKALAHGPARGGTFAAKDHEHQDHGGGEHPGKDADEFRRAPKGVRAGVGRVGAREFKEGGAQEQGCGEPRQHHVQECAKQHPLGTTTGLRLKISLFGQQRVTLCHFVRAQVRARSKCGQLARNRFFGKRRILGFQGRANDDVDDDEGRQHEAGDKRRRKQRLDRGFRNQPIDDQNDGRRDHGAKRAGRTDHPNGEVLIIAQPQHLRQRNQAQQDNLAPNDPRHGRHDHRHDRGDNCNPAPCPVQPDVQRGIHFLGNARPFQKGGHKDEQRYRYEDVTG